MPAGKRRPPRKRKVSAASEPIPYAAIRVVREIRSGYSSFEAADAVNDLLRRGWVLLGAQFVTSGSGVEAAREFVYVLGSTNPQLGDVARTPDDDHFANLEEFTRRITEDAPEFE